MKNYLGYSAMLFPIVVLITNFFGSSLGMWWYFLWIWTSIIAMWILAVNLLTCVVQIYKWKNLKDELIITIIGWLIVISLFATFIL